MIETSKTSFHGSGGSQRKVTINSNIPASSRQRRRELGKELEGPNNVTWIGDWEPNKKYVKIIHLKNTSLNLLKVKFTSPSTRIFSTPYSSQVIQLAAGSSKELSITFRPAEFVPYLDFIHLDTNEGNYQIKLEAKIQKPRFTFPQNINFEPCSVKEVKSKEFTAQNRSSLDTNFRWFTFPAEFTISPSEGVLGSQGSQKFELSFRPNITSLYKGVAECRFGPEFEYSKKINLTAVSCFPQIFVGTESKMANKTELNFGNVERGQISERKVKLYNPSNVTARLIIEENRNLENRDSEIVPSDISCPVKTAEVPPKGSLNLPILFEPLLASKLELKKTIRVSCSACPQISFVTIDCIAKSTPPVIALSSSIVDFRTVPVNRKHQHHIRLDNVSPIKATFQFLCDGDCSAWAFSPTHGILQPGENIVLTIHFTPIDPAPYYRKVPILIDGMDSPIFIELSGSAFDEDVRPAHLTLENIKTRVSPNVEKIDIESRQRMFRDGKIKITNGYLHAEDEKNPESEEFQNLENGFYSLYEEDSCRIPAVSLSTNSISFGRCIPDGTINAMPIQVTNHTDGEIVAQWYQSTEKGHFSVNPPVRTLSPGGSFIFTARFQLFGGKESVFGGELELNCFYKQMMDYSEVKTSLVSPGWCKTVDVSAHTFSPCSEPFPSSVQMPETIISPPTLSSCPTYTTLLMKSSGSLPVTFHFDDAEYNVFPSVGLIESDAPFQLVVIRSIARDDAHGGELRARLNGDPRYDQTVKVLTLKGKPKINCDSEIYLQPTLVGGQTVQELVVENTAHLPVSFEWFLPAKTLQIAPTTGRIDPLGTIKFNLCFKPTAQKQYLIKPELQYWTHPSQTDTKLFRCISEGVGGCICSATSFLDFGSVMVNKPRVKKLNILNQSNCAVDIDLATVQMVNGQVQSENYLQFENGNSSISFLRLEPRRSKILYLTVCCPKDGNYSWEIYYNMKSSNSTEKSLLTHVTAEVCYPLLRMTHLSCSDLIPKQLLYRWTNVAKIDALLRTTPTLAELDQGAVNDSGEFIDVSFGCSTVNSNPFVLRFEIENPGNTEASFKFLFPADMRLELEGWADNAELSKSQYQILQVEDNKLFQVKPKSAKLGPDERCVIKVIYSHHLVGQHSLPVLLSVDGGRQLPLQFSGVTLSKADQYLHFPSRSHKLKPVELGLLQSPIQEIDFHNGSNSRIHFSIDMESVQQFQEENWNWPVFDILTPKGTIEPHSTGKIYVNFSPLEAREYKIQLQVNIVSGESQIIELCAAGFDPRKPPKEAVSDLDEFLTDGTRIVQTNLLCTLSVDRIKLHDIPLHSPVRRIIFLENRSVTTAAHFNWSGINQLVKIEPKSGTLEPEQRQLVVVEFKAESENGPAFHNIELSCRVTSQNDQVAYMAQLEAWNKEWKRQEEEFVITDNKFPPSQVKLIDPLKIERDTTPVSPYRTLPPISPSIYKQRTRGLRTSDRRARKESIWYKPLPPKPDQLPLTITARTLDRGQYLEKYPDRIQTQFMAVNIPPEGENAEPSEENADSIHATSEEVTMLRVLTGNVVRTLLEDVDVQSALMAQAKEEPCYFAELTGAKWPPQPKNPKKGHLIEKIMMMEDEGSVTPHNSIEEIGTENGTDDAAIEDKICLENVVSQILRNILSSASSGDTLLTAKPRKIIQQPPK